MAFRTFITIFFLLFLIFSSPLLTVDVEFPVIQSLSYFPYSDDTIVEKDKLSITSDLYYSNIYMFNRDRTVINDFEEASFLAGVRYGLWKRLSIELFLKGSVLYGGVMDRFIINFHELFGLNEGGRGEYPVNIVNFKYKSSFDYNNDMLIIYPPVIGFLTGLYGKNGFRINFRAGVGIPVYSRPGQVSDRPFLNTGIIFLYNRGSFKMKLSGYVSFFKLPQWIDPKDAGSRIFMINGELIWKRVFTGFIFRTSPFFEGDISNPAFQIYMGYRISDLIKISMYEEIPPMDTIPDVTFRISFSF